MVFSMKFIPLTKGKVAIVDDEDYDALKCFKWHYNSTGYAVGYVRIGPHKAIAVLMHRLIAGTPPGKQTDHINMNKLDNRKCNLRICTHAENLQHRGKHNDNTTGYKGVSWYGPSKKFRARICYDNTRIYLGYFSTAKEAHEAYKIAALKYHGEFAHT